MSLLKLLSSLLSPAVLIAHKIGYIFVLAKSLSFCLILFALFDIMHLNKLCNNIYSVVSVCVIICILF